MKRREFVALVGGAAAAWAARPWAARAQPSAMPVVGFLNPTSPRLYAPNAAGFRQGLQEVGFVEGQNVHIEYRWAEGDYARLPALAAELAARQVAVIAATGDVASARAAQAATTRIPIVFTIGTDPVRFGLVTSYNRPGGNITGVSAITSTIGTKRVEVLHQLAGFSRLALLMNPDNLAAANEQRDAQDAVRILARKDLVLTVRSKDDFAAAWDAFMREKADALFVGTDPMLLSERGAIADFAARQRVPVMHFDRQYALDGGLASYGTSIVGMYRQAGVYCGQILKGASPAELPVIQPTKFELVINLNSAKALGLNVPDKLLALADEVVE